MGKGAVVWVTARGQGLIKVLVLDCRMSVSEGLGIGVFCFLQDLVFCFFVNTK